MRQVLIRATGRKEHKFGPPEWLRIVHKANEIDPEMFGEPDSIGPWWAGGTSEEYTHARIILRDGGNDTLIASKTDHGCDVLKQAAERLGITAVENIVQTMTKLEATVLDRNV
jgi:hypothetical protein